MPAQEMMRVKVAKLPNGNGVQTVDIAPGSTVRDAFRAGGITDLAGCTYRIGTKDVTLDTVVQAGQNIFAMQELTGNRRSRRRQKGRHPSQRRLKGGRR